MLKTKYETQAQTFLESHGLIFQWTLIGDACPPFCEDARRGVDLDKVNTYPRKTHIHGKHYRLALTRTSKPNQPLVVDFWNSYNDEEYNLALRARFGGDLWTEKHKARMKQIGHKPVRPTAYHMLTTITTSDPGTFEDFCRDYGYDSDSRRAAGTYNAVYAEWCRVKAFFTADELKELQEIQ